MNEYWIEDFTGKLSGRFKDYMFNIRVIKGDTPIKAAREAFKPYGKIRKAKNYENPDVILTAIRRNGDSFVRTSGQLCYMFEEV